MKLLKIAIGAAVLSGILSFSGFAAESSKPSDAKKAKPYTLKTCIVSDEKLGEMGKPYEFVHEGQQFKLCCKSCLKDFNKEPAKYVKKLAQTQKAPKGKAPTAAAHEHSGHEGHQH